MGSLPLTATMTIRLIVFAAIFLFAAEARAFKWGRPDIPGWIRDLISSDDNVDKRSTRDSQLPEDKEQFGAGDDQDMLDVITELINIAKNRKKEKRTGISSLLRIYNQEILRKLQSQQTDSQQLK